MAKHKFSKKPFTLDRMCNSLRRFIKFYERPFNLYRWRLYTTQYCLKNEISTPLHVVCKNVFCTLYSIHDTPFLRTSSLLGLSRDAQGRKPRRTHANTVKMAWVAGVGATQRPPQPERRPRGRGTPPARRPPSPLAPPRSPRPPSALPAPASAARSPPAL